MNKTTFPGSQGAIFQAECDEANLGTISPGGSPRAVEHSKEVTASIQAFPGYQEASSQVDIQGREIAVATDPALIPQNQAVQATGGFFQRMKARNEQMSLMAQESKTRSSELTEKIRLVCYQIRQSLDQLEKKFQSLLEAQEIMHQTGHELQLSLLNELREISYICKEGEQKLEENLQITQFQISNELGRESVIEQLQVAKEMLNDTVTDEIPASPNIQNNIRSLALDTSAVNSMLALINASDKV